jgi:hypothetical protein
MRQAEWLQLPESISRWYAQSPLQYTCRYLIGHIVLYHQPDKMAKSKEDLESRKDNLEQLKKQHGIE